ncbi:MAG: hypothetical protein QW040_02550 [Candidatus Aenigmatarchaeota archaeon]
MSVEEIEELVEWASKYFIGIEYSKLYILSTISESLLFVVFPTLACKIKEKLRDSINNLDEDELRLLLELYKKKDTKESELQDRIMKIYFSKNSS